MLLLLARSASIEVPKVRAVGRSHVGRHPAGDRARRPSRVRSGPSTACGPRSAPPTTPGVSPCSIDVDDLGWTVHGRRRHQRLGGRHDRARRGAAPAGPRPAARGHGAHAAGGIAAIEAALAALGDDGVAAVAALRAGVLGAAGHATPHRRSRRLDRGPAHELSARLGIEEPELVQLRRVTVGPIVQTALLVLAGSALISAWPGSTSTRSADEVPALTLGGVLICFVMAQIARVSGVISTMGASPVPLPVGPVVELQYVVAYIGLAVPSAVGRLAVMMRFFQRVGGSSGIAVGVSAIDSAANFIVQIGAAADHRRVRPRHARLRAHQRARGSGRRRRHVGARHRARPGGGRGRGAGRAEAAQQGAPGRRPGEGGPAVAEVTRQGGHGDRRQRAHPGPLRAHARVGRGRHRSRRRHRRRRADQHRRHRVRGRAPDPRRRRGVRGGAHRRPRRRRA